MVPNQPCNTTSKGSTNANFCFFIDHADSEGDHPSNHHSNDSTSSEGGNCNFTNTLIFTQEFFNTSMAGYDNIREDFTFISILQELSHNASNDYEGSFSTSTSDEVIIRFTSTLTSHVCQSASTALAEFINSNKIHRIAKKHHSFITCGAANLDDSKSGSVRCEEIYG